VLNFLPFVLIFVFLLLGMPVAFALAVSGLLGVCLILGPDAMLGAMGTIPYRTTSSFTMVSIGMFILMAEIATQSGITRRLFAAANSLVGHFRGGLGVATMLASAAFGTLSGSSIAAAATMSRIAIPEMLGRGYSKVFAAGTVSMAGTLAVLIPPSIPLIIYGVLTETSIRALLVAGVMPGILTVLLYIVCINIWIRVLPGTAPERTRPQSISERWEALKFTWPFLLVVFFIFAGLYTGAVTTTEASAVGVALVTLIWLIMSPLKSAGLERPSFTAFNAAFDRALLSTVMILVLLIGAYIFSFYLILTGATRAVEGFIVTHEWSAGAVLAIVIALYIVLGLFMSQLEIMILTLPFVFPILTGLGYDPIWLGIIVVKTIEIGLVTPPVGLNVYVVATSSGQVTPTEGFRGVAPFLLVEFIILGILIAAPEIVTFLPALMSN